MILYMAVMPGQVTAGGSRPKAVAVLFYKRWLTAANLDRDLSGLGCCGCCSTLACKGAEGCFDLWGSEGRGALAMDWCGEHREPRLVTLCPQGNTALVQAVCLHTHNAAAPTPIGTRPLEEAI